MYGQSCQVAGGLCRSDGIYRPAPQNAMDPEEMPSPSHEGEPLPLGSRLVRWLRYLLGALVMGPIAGFFLFTELGRVAAPSPEGKISETIAMAELASQLRVPFGKVAIFGVFVLIALRLWRTAFVALSIVVISVYPLWKLRPVHDAPVATHGESLRIVSANLLASNRDRDAALEAIAAEDADVITLLEVTRRWREDAIARLGDDYPYYTSGSDEGEWAGNACGQMLLSRFPIQSSRALEVHSDGVELRPVVEAVLDWSGTPLTIHVIHPVRPSGARRLRARTAVLERVAAAGPARDARDARVIIGDFNTTSSSPLFRRLVRATGLRDSRLGFGLNPTYTPHHPEISPHLPFGWEPSVPIDHALVSPDLVVTGRSTFSVPGSDHLGITLTLQNGNDRPGSPPH